MEELDESYHSEDDLASDEYQENNEDFEVDQDNIGNYESDSSDQNYDAESDGSSERHFGKDL